MTTNLGKNERGRKILYGAVEPSTGVLMFQFEAGRFSRKMAAREAAKRGVMLPIKVRWATFNRWGMDFHERLVSA